MRDLLNTMNINEAIFASIVAWFFAQGFKIVTVLIQQKKLDLSRIVGTGGMPSSHSALTSSLAASVGYIDGFNSTTFSIALILNLVVMYDASGIRRAAGNQAKVLNEVVKSIESGKFKKELLKEMLGHTPLEVLVGFVLGITVSSLMNVYL